MMQRTVRGDRVAKSHHFERLPAYRPARAPGRGPRERFDPFPQPASRELAASSRETLCEPTRCPPQHPGRGIAVWGRYRLAEDSVDALQVVGMFRVMHREDVIARFRSRRRAGAAVRELTNFGLLTVDRLQRGSTGVEAVSLTARGRGLLERHIDPREPGDTTAQTYRSGRAGRHQVLHDASVYRAARQEMDALASRGARVVRIRSDSDLRSEIAGRVERHRRDGLDRAAASRTALDAMDLIECDGRAVLPDVRIVHRELGDHAVDPLRHVDVEVTTPDYRSAAVAAKTNAGFRMYRMDVSGGLTGP